MERFVITGPTGWIGSALLERLAVELGETFSDQVMLFGSHSRRIEIAGSRTVQIRALDDLRPSDCDGAHIVHLAYLTKEKAESLGDDTFVSANRAIDSLVLDAIERASPASLFVASSGAAKLAEHGVDTHSYGIMKREQEERFLAWAERTDAPAIVGRIFALAGPHINKLGSYAISDMLLQARDTGQIHIKAEVPVFRNYLHVMDLAALILGCARSRLHSDQPVDLCGAEILEMGDVATAISRATGSVTAIVRDELDYARTSSYLGKFTDTKLLAMKCGIPLTPFSVQITDTMGWLQRQNVYAKKR